MSRRVTKDAGAGPPGHPARAARLLSRPRHGFPRSRRAAGMPLFLRWRATPRLASGGRWRGTDPMSAAGMAPGRAGSEATTMEAAGRAVAYEVWDVRTTRAPGDRSCRIKSGFA